MFCRYLARKGDVLEPRDVDAIVRAVRAEERGGADAGGSKKTRRRVEEHPARAECLAACAANHSCQRFRVASAHGEGE